MGSENYMSRKENSQSYLFLDNSPPSVQTCLEAFKVCVDAQQIEENRVFADKMVAEWAEKQGVEYKRLTENPLTFMDLLRKIIR